MSKTAIGFNYLNPYIKRRDDIKTNLAESLEIDSVYIHISYLKIKSNRKRPIYKVINKANNKFVLRKLRGKNVLKKNEITFDRLTFNELDLNLDNISIEIKSASKLKQYTSYFWYHPKEDIRVAYKFFLLGLLIGLISILIGIIGIMKQNL